jgi:hypothetical protein
MVILIPCSIKFQVYLKFIEYNIPYPNYQVNPLKQETGDSSERQQKG